MLDELLTRLEHLLALLTPGARDRVQHLAEGRHAVTRLRREVRAAGERFALRRQEDRHRPAAAAVQRDDGVHVDRIEVRSLLAVDLDVDEVLVHERRRLRVLERLALHHVTPVTCRVADREQDRLVFIASARERLVAPRVPVDRVPRVLQQVRARLVGQAVRHRTGSAAD